MKEISVICEMFEHIYMKFLLLFKSWKGITILIPTILLANFMSVPWLLCLFFISTGIDFATGFLASYIEIKNGTKERTESGYIFESKRARQSGVKLIGYLTVFFFVYVVDSIFFNRTFEIAYVANKNMTITQIVICGAIALEAYSAIIENLTRAGFDLFGKIGKMADSIWTVVRKIKGEDISSNINDQDM